MPRILSALKNVMIRDQVQPRRIPFGLYRGKTLNVNLAHQAQLFFGLWEAELNGAVRKGLSNSTWFVDIGAGAGEMSVLAVNYPRMRRVVAIDANATEAEKARANIALNGLLDRIEVIPKFAGAEDGETTVSVDSLDLPAGPGFLKIDVDGAEVEVLSGCNRLLVERAVHLLIETHSRSLEEDCIAYLRHRGYNCQIIPQAWWRAVLPEQRPLDHNRWLFAERPQMAGA